MNTKRLYKSNDRKVAGVCGGIAEYFNIDPTLVRLIWIFVVLVGGSGVLLYFVASIVMEDAPDYREANGDNYRNDFNYSGVNESYNNADNADASKDTDQVVGFKYEE